MTVTAIGDDDAEPNASVTLSHTVRGADYGNVRVGFGQGYGPRGEYARHNDRHVDDADDRG